jgi:hypothetical protein
MLALQNVQAAHRRLRSRVRVKATHADKKITSRSFGMLSFAITGASYITKEYDWGKIDLELNATLHL